MTEPKREELEGMDRRHHRPPWVDEILERIDDMEERIMGTEAELQAAIDAVKGDVDSLAATLGSVSTNLGTQIANLQAAVAAGNVPSQADIDALTAVHSSLQGVVTTVTDPAFGQPAAPPPPPGP